MKSLEPSRKENKRYLQIVGKNSKENIERAIMEFGGISGLSKCGLSFIKSEGNYSIISVNREAVNLVRAGLAVFPEKMDVLRVSGTLKGLRKST